MKKIMIIEDEAASQAKAVECINQIGGYEIAAVCQSVKGAIENVQVHLPDILLLDIHIEGGTAFDVLSQIEIDDTKLIFTTAFDKYAVKAFEMSAIHYLLKPYTCEDLKVAFKRYEDSEKNLDIRKNLKQLTHNLSSTDMIEKLIGFPTHAGWEVYSIKEVVRLEAEGNTSILYTSDGKQLRVFEQLKTYEEKLTHTCFFRSHKSHLVNLGYVRKVATKKELTIELRNGESIPLSVRRKPELIESLRLMAN